MRSKRLTVCLALLAALLAGPAQGAERTPKAVYFMLDCSASMATPMPAEAAADGEDASASDDATRMDVAKDALRAKLTEISADGAHRAGLWLFGHRLAWSEGDEPTLLDQGEYLEATLGYKVLGELMPGDDVELARPISTLEPEQLESVFQRLDAVKPWGESPLYLSLTRALDSMPREVTGDVQLVVIANAGNRQGISKFVTKKTDVFEALERRPAPIHLIQLGLAGKNEKQTEAEFRQIAHRSGGSYSAANSAAELTVALDTILFPRKAARRRAQADDSELANTPRDESEDAVSALGRGTKVGEKGTRLTATEAKLAPLDFEISGRVLYYGRPIRKATVTLSGEDSATRVTGEDGRYEFSEVAPGKYTLTCEAVVKNVTRTTTGTVTIKAKAEDDIVYDLKLDESL